MILEQQLRKILYCIYPVLLYVVIQELFILFTNQSPLLSSALAALIALIPIGYLFVHDQKKYSQHTKGTVKKLLCIVPLITGMAAGIGLSSATTLISVHQHFQSYNEVSEQLFSDPFLIQFLATGILIPVAEELLFRGLVYGRIRAMTEKKIIAMICTSVLFALFHGNIVQGIGAGIASMLICFMYESYGHIFAAIIFHMGFNIPAVILTKMNVRLHSEMTLFTILIICTLITGFSIFIIYKNIPKGSTDKTHSK